MSEAAHPSSGSRAATSSSTSSELELIEQLKQQLAGPLFAAVSDQFSHLQNTVVSYQNKLQYAELKIRVLEERLRLIRIAKYGPGSEKLSDAQLELLELEPGVSRAEVQAESERPPVQPSTKTKRPHPGRQELPANLPRVERILACTPEQSVCKGCGKQTTVIGHEESSQLDVEPAKYFVLVSKREKRACKSCEEQGVVSAPLPPRIIEKCLASDQIVIDTLVSKYCDHQPLYRQSAMLERDSGVELSRATLDGWVLKVGELLIPMAAAMRQELIRGTYIQADETPVDVQMHEGRPRERSSALRSDRRPREEPSSLSMAVQSTERNGGVRLPFGPRTGWTETVSGTVRRSSADRRLPPSESPARKTLLRQPVSLAVIAEESDRRPAAAPKHKHTAGKRILC